MLKFIMRRVVRLMSWLTSLIINNSLKMINLTTDKDDKDELNRRIEKFTEIKQKLKNWEVRQYVKKTKIDTYSTLVSLETFVNDLPDLHD